MNKHLRKYAKTILPVFLIVSIALFLFLYSASERLKVDYRSLESVAIKDRNGELMTEQPNAKGDYGIFADGIPSRVGDLLVKKEDRFFYFHSGVNPFSITEALWRYVVNYRSTGASTITQQLVKNLLGNGQKRTLPNKIVEALYALDLELFTSKKDILTMYADTVPMGNQIEGLPQASQVYFGTDLSKLDDTKITMLLASLSSPSTTNPWKAENKNAAKSLAARIGVSFIPELAKTSERESAYTPPHSFELASMHESCDTTCTTTLDKNLTDSLRAILLKRTTDGTDVGGTNGAIVVVKLPENELLALVGTPDENSTENGNQINMTLQPRAIGSTAKPFIYLEGFEKGLRPYTQVDDREYKFMTADGFPLYPKNYDGQYRGWITLHSALSNSLNVPTVKVLQYVGLPNFYSFLEQKLGFVPLQDIDTYGYGIALGALEMDPLDLAHYLTIFPQNGILKPLKLFSYKPGDSGIIATPMSNFISEKKIADPQFAQLVTKVLSDRITGVEQFGLAGNLNLSQNNYAVKTGTSEDYHDTWTVGYTPDFLVVTWFGNAQNKALKQVTGASGAGAVWHDAMELLFASSYNKKTPLSTEKVSDVQMNGTLDFGLPGEKVADHENLLQDDALITSPQDRDNFELESGTRIPLEASENVEWSANGKDLGQGTEIFFSPTSAGDYVIKAVGQTQSQSITVHVIKR